MIHAVFPVLAAGCVVGLKAGSYLVTAGNKLKEIAELRANALMTACPERQGYLRKHFPHKKLLPAVCFSDEETERIRFDHAYKYWFKNDHNWLKPTKELYLARYAEHHPNEK